MEGHLKESPEDGLRVVPLGIWMLPYVRVTVLFQSEEGRKTPISFCPWCGRDVKALFAQLEDVPE